jgi:hypothetical protein
VSLRTLMIREWQFLAPPLTTFSLEISSTRRDPIKQPANCSLISIIVIFRNNF